MQKKVELERVEILNEAHKNKMFDNKHYVLVLNTAYVDYAE